MVNRLLRQMPAPCRQAPDAWFPDGLIGHAARAELEAAASVCKSMCTLRKSCLELAMRAEGNLSAQNRYGVYGGLVPAERADLAKRRQAARQELAA